MREVCFKIKRCLGYCCTNSDMADIERVSSLIKRRVTAIWSKRYYQMSELTEASAAIGLVIALWASGG
ncbi:hypothetical protein GA0061101_11571 [Rhizobium lusitanum]|jgi:hypothetical protein|uniref:Uncharacterized protein n=1 Tax=Rhizobium lusitanum TaxID=293958 RepID=A0A1C3WQR6_9HYPH|nr:hypothetical protein GA0061101_11571 [Rhizobium lusitanum]